ncbi:MAG: hypothetical protein RIB84_26090 [Sneathiellaceae bacterium]
MAGAGSASCPGTGDRADATGDGSGGALPLLTAAFAAAERQYGGRETASAMISIVVAHAMGWRLSRLYSEIFRANAAILDDCADDFPD